MPEGIVDDGTLADSGHASGRSSSGKRRPDDVPAGFVFDRKAKTWREPRKPGPRPADDMDGDADPDLGDGGWRADRDPGAAHLSGGEEPRPRPQLTDEVRNDVEGLLALLALPVGALAESRDPICGAVFADNLPQIVTAAAPIVCRSERVMRWMTADSGGLMDWIGLARALAPVAAVVVQHHVLRTIGTEDEFHQLVDEAGAAA